MAVTQFNSEEIKSNIGVASINKFSESATKDSRVNQLQQKQKQKGRITPLLLRKQQAIQLINQKEHSNQR